MDFYHRFFKAGSFYFGFDEDSRNLIDIQSFSKIGRGRVVNVVCLDESGVSYKQYSKEGCFDSNEEKLINDINFRFSRSSKKGLFVFSIILLAFPCLFILSLILMLFMGGISEFVNELLSEEEMWFLPLISLFTFALTGLLLLFYSKKIKKPCLVYDIAPEKEQKIKTFYENISKLDESEKIWFVKTVERHSDTRYSAGAKTSISRNETYYSKSLIRNIQMNVCIPNIGNKLYFLPEAILYYSVSEWKYILYKDIEIQLSTSNFRESEEIPSDSEQIGSTWKYVNNDGSRDKRFNDNRKIPIMKYCEIIIKTNLGFIIRFQTSNYEIGNEIANILHNYKI